MWRGALAFIFAGLSGIILYNYTQDVILAFVPVIIVTGVGLFLAAIRWYAWGIESAVDSSELISWEEARKIQSEKALKDKFESGWEDNSSSANS